MIIYALTYSTIFILMWYCSQSSVWGQTIMATTKKEKFWLPASSTQPSKLCKHNSQMLRLGYNVFNLKRWEEKNISTGHTHTSAGIAGQLRPQIKGVFRILSNI